MKKLIFIVLVLISASSFGQYNPTYDTVKFRRGGKIYQLYTYGNNDSIKINGTTYYMASGGPESDPVWISDSSEYYKKAQALHIFALLSHTQAQSTITGLEDSIAHRIPLHLGTTTTNKDTVIFYHAGVYKTGSMSQIQRYSAYSSGNNNVEVLADGAGITANLANTNEITFTIPAGVKIISAKVRVSSISQLKIFMGTSDMGNSTLANRWMPISQAWREDTGQQLMGLTCLMELATHDKFTINGLINTTICHVRIEF